MKVGKDFLPQNEFVNLRQSLVFPAAGQKGSFGWDGQSSGV